MNCKLWTVKNKKFISTVILFTISFLYACYTNNEATIQFNYYSENLIRENPVSATGKNPVSQLHEIVPKSRSEIHYMKICKVRIWIQKEQVCSAITEL